MRCFLTARQLGRDVLGPTRIGRQAAARDRSVRRQLVAALPCRCGNGPRSPRRAPYLRAQYRRLSPRRGKQRARQAVGHSILVACWHVLASENADYVDVGHDWFDRRNAPRSAHVASSRRYGRSVVYSTQTKMARQPSSRRQPDGDQTEPSDQLARNEPGLSWRRQEDSALHASTFGGASCGVSDRMKTLLCEYGGEFHPINRSRLRFDGVRSSIARTC